MIGSRVVAESGTEATERAPAVTLPHPPPGPAAEGAARDGRPTPGERRGYYLRRILVLADLVGLATAMLGADLARALVGRGFHLEEAVVLVSVMPLWIPLGISAGLYHVDARTAIVGAADELAEVLRVATTWSWVALIASAAVHTGPVELFPLVTLWAFSIVTVPMGRALARRVARSRRWYRQRTLVVGYDSDRLIARIGRHPEWGFEVVGHVGQQAAGGRFNRVDGNGPTDRSAAAVMDWVNRFEPARVIFTPWQQPFDERSAICRWLSERGIQVDLVSGDADILRANASLHDLEGLPTLTLPAVRPARWQGVLKRAADLAIAIPMLIAASPLLAFAAIRIRRDSPGPVLFRQQRAGRYGKPFTVLKFRTMIVDAEDRRPSVAALAMHRGGARPGIFKVAEDPRVTSSGAWLRRWSIDELPQLWNVVRGEMSIVGPRPLPMAEDRQIAQHYGVRRLVRPGITGSWQVRGRSDIPYADMVKLDYTYVVNWSFGEDLKLIGRTISAVIAGRGAY